MMATSPPIGVLCALTIHTEIQPKIARKLLISFSAGAGAGAAKEKIVFSVVKQAKPPETATIVLFLCLALITRITNTVNLLLALTATLRERALRGPVWTSIFLTQQVFAFETKFETKKAAQRAAFPCV